MLWMGILIALPITFLSNWIIKFFYGQAYLASTKVLLISIWSNMFVFLGVASSQYLLTENYTHISFYRTFLGAISNVILNVFLIPLYGIDGAAFATVISYCISTFFIVLIPKTKKQAILMLRSIVQV
jgi:O-antigen/teichoic acid export membrane protein